MSECDPLDCSDAGDNGCDADNGGDGSDGGVKIVIIVMVVTVGMLIILASTMRIGMVFLFFQILTRSWGSGLFLAQRHKAPLCVWGGGVLQEGALGLGVWSAALLGTRSVVVAPDCVSSLGTMTAETVSHELFTFRMGILCGHAETMSKAAWVEPHASPSFALFRAFEQPAGGLRCSKFSSCNPQEDRQSYTLIPRSAAAGAGLSSLESACLMC